MVNGLVYKDYLRLSLANLAVATLICVLFFVYNLPQYYMESGSELSSHLNRLVGMFAVLLLFSIIVGVPAGMVVAHVLSFFKLNHYWHWALGGLVAGIICARFPGMLLSLILQDHTWRYSAFGAMDLLFSVFSIPSALLFRWLCRKEVEMLSPQLNNSAR